MKLLGIVLVSALLVSCVTSETLEKLRIPEAVAQVDLANSGKRSLTSSIVRPVPAPVIDEPTAPVVASTITPRPLVADSADIDAIVRHQKRVALVIGNAAYAYVGRLRNPSNDAHAIAKALKAKNFEVINAVDQTKLQIDQTVRRFSEQAEGADVALYYYSGHAMQVDGKNWMLPVDANIKKKSDVALQANPMSLVIDQMSARAGINIIMLDACRDNPFEREMVASTRGTKGGKGLARMETGRQGESYLAFATAPGEVAQDGYGNYSPFSESLMKHLAVPNIELEELMRLVRKDVKEATINEEVQQVPWGNSSLTEKFYF